VETLVVCGFCGASLVREADGTVRRAVAKDLDVLAPSELVRLTTARAALARPERRR
jgi:hypothetical protein